MLLNPASNAPQERGQWLTGARQTGKTSTFLRLFPKHAFVSLDLPAEAEQAEKEPGTFLQRHPPPVLIDEVQYAPGLFRHLKVAVDANRKRNGQFLLTGSQKFTLMKNVSESLAGRSDIVELETLSFVGIQCTGEVTAFGAVVRIEQLLTQVPLGSFQRSQTPANANNFPPLTSKQ